MNSRLPQSAAFWCLQQAGLETGEICVLAEKLGLQIDLPPQKRWATILGRGLKISSVMADMGKGKAPYEPGFADTTQWDFVEGQLIAIIEAAAEKGIKRVLVFSGYKPMGVHRDQAIKNVIDGFTRKVVRRAEELGVVLCLEMLNTICANETMEGHPLYLLDCTADTMTVVNGINSANLLLAADWYHQGVMGQPSLTLTANHAAKTGIIHTASFNLLPGMNRCPLHMEGQMIDFLALVNAAVAAGYTGPVVHEFLYRDADPEVALTAAIALCS